MRFDGQNSALRVPFNEDIDPSTWPYQIEINVKPESDGVIAMQSSNRYGYKLFVQDGRPGITVLCKSWIALHTTIDSEESILGKWTQLEAYIDYNRVIFSVDGNVVESRALPHPFKGKTNSPLIVGAVGKHVVSEDVPHSPFKGDIRSIRIRRELVKESSNSVNFDINILRSSSMARGSDWVAKAMRR